MFSGGRQHTRPDTLAYEYCLTSPLEDCRAYELLGYQQELEVENFFTVNT